MDDILRGNRTPNAEPVEGANGMSTSEIRGAMVPITQPIPFTDLPLLTAKYEKYLRWFVSVAELLNQGCHSLNEVWEKRMKRGDRHPSLASLCSIRIKLKPLLLVSFSHPVNIYLTMGGLPVVGLSEDGHTAFRFAKAYLAQLDLEQGGAHKS